jgi:hypothetical protein
MPDLSQSLQGRDLGHLRIVAQCWGIELNAPDARVGLQRLLPAMLERAAVDEVVESLPVAARAALDDLLLNEGRLSWSLFTRRYGEVREMGPGRRDRQRPYENTTSAAELLWYRGLVGRAFFDTPTGSEEFAYIPEELLELIPVPEPGASPVTGRPASKAERAHPIPANDRILDHACTLLAALRLGLSLDTLEFNQGEWETSPENPYPLTPLILQALLAAAGLLDGAGIPKPEPTRKFLEADRSEALALLARAWLDSAKFNELHLIPGLQVEGEWQNDPVLARHEILDFLFTVPGRDDSTRRLFWSLPGFVTAIYQTRPDFQRPAGDYDSWYLRDLASGEFLRGFEHWEQVDGALIRYIITGLLHWLGVLDLASPAINAPPAAFRYSDWAARLLAGEAPQGLSGEDGLIHVGSDARLQVPCLAPRAVRYQIARFGDWEGEKEDGYRYRLTLPSLERARQQGLKLSHLLALLRRHASNVPPSLVKALERWDEHGSQARLEKAVVLRLNNPDLLQALRNSRAARFLGDPLGPTTIIVKPGAMKKVMEVLAELGYLVEGEIEGD